MKKMIVSTFAPEATDRKWRDEKCCYTVFDNLGRNQGFHLSRNAQERRSGA
jgi:hypothetical protein